MKTSHVFDLDNCIFNIDRKIWIIDKSNPTKPLLKISESDFNLIESGVFKSDNNSINFSGKTYWLSDRFYNKIKITIKNKKSNLNNLGISLQEFVNKDVIDTLKVDIDMSVLEPIKNTTDDIIFIVSKTIKEKYKKHIKKLEDKLTKEGFKISDWFYINQSFYDQSLDSNAFKKSLVLSRLLLGQVPDMKKFTNETYKSYDVVNFYDTSNKSIESAINIQDTIDALYTKSEDSIKDNIKNRLKNNIILNVFKVTTNKFNTLVKTEVKLSPPRSIMVFESFLRFKNFHI